MSTRLASGNDFPSSSFALMFKQLIRHSAFIISTPSSDSRYISEGRSVLVIDAKIFGRKRPLYGSIFKTLPIMKMSDSAIALAPANIRSPQTRASVRSAILAAHSFNHARRRCLDWRSAGPTRLLSARRVRGQRFEEVTPTARTLLSWTEHGIQSYRVVLHCLFTTWSKYASIIL